ncbi:MAG: septum formation inhibitor Maf [Leeuwenhoekiella sp.]
MGRAVKLLSLFLIILFSSACSHTGPQRSETTESYAKTAYKTRKLTKAFEDYWFSGEAEITTYRLQQSRYGELRDGKAVLIYVNEDFKTDEQVKADQQSDNNISILKLNRTKNFVTGIYPYSIMTSTFFPIVQQSHAIKVSTSIQEWCGHQYMQINNRGNFEISSHSYFDGEADQNYAIQKDILEDELWSQLRIDPNSLPIGKQKVVPGIEYIRLNHRDLKAYNANISKTDSTYTIAYPELERTIRITFEKEFPYSIKGWQESTANGANDAKEIITATATKMNTLKTAYWKQNASKFEYLRDTLGL